MRYLIRNPIPPFFSPFEAISTDIKRQDLFITSKLWNTEHAPKDVVAACKQTLSDMKLDYLDLYLVHWPVAFGKSSYITSAKDASGAPQFAKVSLQETWKAMEDLVDAKLTRSIGVSNYTVPVLLDLLTYARIKPAVNQFEIHPYFNRSKLRTICNRFGVHATGYSPLGSGKEGALQDPLVVSLAKKYNVTPAQILLRWSHQLGNTVIPKSVTPERIGKNISIFHFDLTNEDMEAINALERGQQVCVLGPFWDS